MSVLSTFAEGLKKNKSKLAKEFVGNVSGFIVGQHENIINYKEFVSLCLEMSQKAFDIAKEAAEDSEISEKFEVAVEHVLQDVANRINELDGILAFAKRKPSIKEAIDCLKDLSKKMKDLDKKMAKLRVKRAAERAAKEKEKEEEQE